MTGKKEKLHYVTIRKISVVWLHLSVGMVYPNFLGMAIDDWFLATPVQSLRILCDECFIRKRESFPKEHSNSSTFEWESQQSVTQMF